MPCGIILNRRMPRSRSPATSRSGRACASNPRQSWPRIPRASPADPAGGGRMAERSATAPTWLDLFDWRTRVADLYGDRDAAHRRADDPAATLARFRAAKDALFTHHPQTPFGPDALAGFTGLRYFPYAPALRVAADLVVDEGVTGEALPFGEALLRPAGRVRFAIAGASASALLV